MEDSGAIEEISESRSRGRPDKLSPQSSDAVSEPLNN
jgi:S-adenosylmethionine synthetase